ncbi:MAG TPA: formylglycine-generating enzyme family protein [Accumulibacter sp.]|nr:formylglycine-generating enzyme family protein [Accumulibacter sp.]
MHPPFPSWLFYRPGVARRAARGAPPNPAGRSPFPARAALIERFDRLPLPIVGALGVILGGGLGALGLLYGEASTWLIVAPVLFVAVGWLGDTAAPLFDEKAPNKPPAPPARPRRVIDSGLPMVELPGGEFMLGSPAADEMTLEREMPQHAVTLTPFRMALTPVTVALYREVMAQPAASDDTSDARLPVTEVTWFDALDFCNRLSVRAGYRPCYTRLFGIWRCDWRADGYRLPTEAEWEYACRAGTTSRYSFGDDPAALDAYAWYAGNANDQAQPVAGKRANAWGLYDLHGNVWEWCWDWYGKYSAQARRNPHGAWRWKAGGRVVRGGSFGCSPGFLRSARRDGVEPARGIGALGFRCVRVPPQPRPIDAW